LQKELLDGDNIPFSDIKKNMQELHTINQLLGGHRITLSGMKKLVDNTPFTEFVVCEIGCGGGDNMYAIHQWMRSNSINVKYIGIDIKKDCILFASQQYPSLPATWITGDYAHVSFVDQKPDIIFSSLFCHHFTEAELLKMLKWMKENSSRGFFINDLHRHPLAYYSIKWLTQLFSGSYLVKTDAPLSVARGFQKNEWKDLFRKAGISNYSISWKWAFRHLIIYKHE